MRRIVLIGASCSGKTTLGGSIAKRLGLPFTEFDAIAWRPKWSSPSDEELLAMVKSRTASDGWVIEGLFPEHEDLVWSKADTIIWLNYPMSLVFFRALWRTAKRCITRERLGEHNVETWRRTFFSSNSQLLWVIECWRKFRRDVPRMFRQPKYQHLRTFTFSHPRQTEAWLAKLKTEVISPADSPEIDLPEKEGAVARPRKTAGRSNQSRHEIAMLCGADDVYAMPLAVMIYSASANLAPRWRLRVFIMDAGISESSRRLIERKTAALGNVDLEWCDLDLGAFSGLPTLGYLKSPIYLRLQMDKILPPDLERVIYLDADLLVEGDLSELWQQDFGGATVLAVHDYGEAIFRANLPLPGVKKSRRETAPYFNSGVMVIDLNRWRKDEVGQAAMEYIRRYKSLVEYPDQDALNAVLFGKWRPLDLTWNAQVDNLIHPEQMGNSQADAEILHRRDELLYHPRVRHYAGVKKPWNPGRFRPVRKRFVHYLHASGWHDPLELMGFHIRWAWSTAGLGLHVLRQKLNRQKLITPSRIPSKKKPLRAAA
jgi:lipopolysaccharide biosynthesis glycosyltransferase/adenylate kinase family enzyme